VKSRAYTAWNALRYIDEDLEDLEDHHRRVVEDKDRMYASLKHSSDGVKALQKTTYQRLEDKTASVAKLTAEVKELKKQLAERNGEAAVEIGKLKQELVVEKAKKKTDEEAERRLAELVSENAKLTSEANYLQQEIKAEMARSAANSGANKELDALKANLAAMVAGGVKIKTEKGE
jgi:regulator of replication initiation timing